MYGQMTAGSWIYIGTQGIVQGTFETFAAMADRHFGGDLAGRLVVSGGMGGMGGAQPLAATMNGAVFLGVDVDRARIERRVRDGLLRPARSRLRRGAAHLRGRASSRSAPSRSGSSATAPRCCPSSSRRGVKVDAVTDQTSAHDPLNGYVPAGVSLEEAEELRRTDPKGYVERSTAVDGAARRGDARLAARGRGRLRLRQQHPQVRLRRGLPRTPSRFPASSPSTSARSSARAKARSAGSRSRATPKTSAAPTTSRSNSSPKTGR